jgi:hypothetical protein
MDFRFMYTLYEDDWDGDIYEPTPPPLRIRIPIDHDPVDEEDDPAEDYDADNEGDYLDYLEYMAD